MAEKLNEMDKVIEKMMEHVCDDICRFKREVSSQEDLEAVCAECEMGHHICEVLNCYQVKGENRRYQNENDGVVSTTNTFENEV